MELMRAEGSSFFNRASDRKQVIDPGCLKELENARSDSGSDETYTFVLTANEVADDEAEATGVHVGNVGEVEDGELRRVLRRGFSFEEVLKGGGTEGGVHVSGGEGAGETKDERGGGAALRAFDVEAGAFPDLSGCG